MTALPLDYPEEYITGSVHFFGREFGVTPDVLIPRLETESLVRKGRQILKNIPQDNSMRARNWESEGDKLSESDESKKQISRANEFLSPSGPFGTFQSGKVQNIQKRIVIDIGTGSGIIGTSLADLADEVIFLDISPEALRIAECNFRTHFPDKKARFITSDLLSALPKLEEDTQILYVTNLPYIKADDWKNMSPDTVHEPRLALFGGAETGFELYDRLFEELSHLYPSSIQLSNYPTILYEFGFDQREIAETSVQKYPRWEYSFFADYAGVERFGEIVIR